MKVLVSCVGALGILIGCVALAAADEPASSRVERTTLAPPGQVTILTRDDLVASGLSTVGEVLERLPAEASAIFPQDSDGSVRIDLRGLGAQRTLILLDGRPIVPGATGAADVSLIPLIAVDRVEILLGGAAMIYGSGAIGGVVNIVTRSDLDGTAHAVYGGISQHGHATVYEASSVAGQRWADGRARLFLAGDVRRQDPVLVGDRAPDAGAAGSVAYLQAGSTRESFHGAGSYELTPGVVAFVEAGYLHDENDMQLEGAPLSPPGTALVISKDSLYNPTGADVVDFNRHVGLLGPRVSTQFTHLFRGAAGVRGAVPDDAPVVGGWRWELSYSYGRTYETVEAAGDPIPSHVAAAIGPSFPSATGGPTCGTQTAPIAGCVPIGLIPPGFIDAAAIAYLRSAGTTTGWNEQQAALATARGRIAEWAQGGELSGAVGVDVRERRVRIGPSDDVANPRPAVRGSYSLFEGFGEILAVPVRDRPLADRVELDLAVLGFRGSTFGSGVTWTAGGSWRPIEGVALRGAHATTYRAPSIGELFDQRSGVAFVEDPCDIHPPSKRDPTPLPPTVAAECLREGVPANSQFGTAQQPTVTGGNPHLEAETAQITTLGARLDPPALHGLSLGVDYWRIGLDHGVAPGFIARSVLANCYQQGLPSFCDRIHRDPARGHAIDLIEVTDGNSGALSTSGIDLAAGYRGDLGAAGRLRAQLSATYLLDYRTTDAPEPLPPGIANVTTSRLSPTLVAALASSWAHPSGLGAGVGLSYVGGFDECGMSACTPGEAPTEVAAWYALDVHASYAFTTVAGRTTAAAGINNLLDRQPSLLTLPDGSGLRSTYDVVGRFAYVRLVHEF